jgi:alpha-glucosidase
VMMLHVFVPDEDGEFHSVLHEDDGITLAFSRGAFYRTAFRLTRRGAALSVTAAVTGGGFAEFRRRAFRFVFHGFSDGEIVFDGRPLRAEHGVVEVANRGDGFTMSLVLAGTRTVEPRHQPEGSGPDGGGVRAKPADVTSAG